MGSNDIPFLNTGIWNGKLFLSGWNAASAAHEILEPATGSVLTRVGMATPADVAEAAKRARAAQAACRRRGSGSSKSPWRWPAIRACCCSTKSRPASPRRK